MFFLNPYLLFCIVFPLHNLQQIVTKMIFSDNKARVYYGLLKEPDVSNAAIEEEEDDEEGGDKPKKKKSKKDHLYPKKSKSDPNAPPVDRMPLPELLVSLDMFFVFLFFVFVKTFLSRKYMYYFTGKKLSYEKKPKL